MQELRSSWGLLSLLFAAVLALLSVIAFFIDSPRLWAAWAILLVALTAVAVSNISESWGAWMHFHIYGWRYKTIVKWRYIVYDSTGQVARGAYYLATDRLTGVWFFCVHAT